MTPGFQKLRFRICLAGYVGGYCVHHTGLKIEKEQYKYLVQGEYINFNLTKSSTDTHEFQATNVTGAYGGVLMCETRNANQYTREKGGKRTRENEVSFRD